MIKEYTPREKIIEIVNKLFIYTDFQDWKKLQEEVFAEKVELIMNSLKQQQAQELSPAEICDMWREGFKELDAIHHQAGNYIVKIETNHAHVLAYAIASHYKKSATLGTTREFIGSYDFDLVYTEDGWRICKFTYHLKYMKGNLDLE